jgi:LysR family glycine cleavage system transcriptional activator
LNPLYIAISVSVHIIYVMNSRRIRLPSLRCLQSFEAAARLSSFTAAAIELHTSQSSISRHVADLEQMTGGQLFVRERQRVHLSDRGEHLFRSVTHGLNSIQSGMEIVSNWAQPSRVTIACTHAVSQLVLLPKFEALNAALAGTAQVRIMTYEYEAMNLPIDPQIDIIFEYGRLTARDSDRVIVLPEAVRPFASPEFADQHQAALSNPVSSWSGLPFLTLSLPNRGWATWDDWFQEHGLSFTGESIEFENYVYLLEAAVAGRGIALGARGLLESYVQSGRLIALGDEYLEFDRALYAVLTEQGKHRAAARLCLAELACQTPD